ncbi:MAG: DMT family transporter [Roseibium sp.]
MLVLFPALAAMTASFGWAGGIVLAQMPAQRLGAFEFTRIQLLSCAAIMAALSSLLGLWQSVELHYWPAYTVSIVIGILLGNLAMIECLRLGGPRLTELLLCLKAPIVALLAYFWLGETLKGIDIIGVAVVLVGVVLAILASHENELALKRSARNLLPVFLLGAFAAACQGGGFLVVKPLLEIGAEPIAVSAIRLVGAAAIISLIGIWPAHVFRPHAEATPYLVFRTVLPGVIGYGVSSSLLLYAFANMEAGIAAVLGSLSPLFVLPILWAKTKKRPNTLAVLGAVLAIAGTSLIVLF